MGGKVVNSMLMTDCITAVMDMGDDKRAPRDDKCAPRDDKRAPRDDKRAPRDLS